MITRGDHGVDWAGAGVTLMPVLVAVLFVVLSLELQAPTAGGLAFLAAALVAVYFFPRVRVRASRLAGSVLFALGLGALLSALLSNLGRG
ncbi:MAG TPA: hypothetical protein VEY09_06505 [Pyrinomonadaceae bacterium]|nr:hypothetical protein [Pyrinomonadaceae bacterium]